MPDEQKKAMESISSFHVLKKLKKLAHRQLAAKREVEAAEHELERRKAQLREIEDVFIPDAMDSLGLMEYTTDDGLTIAVISTIRANISKARKEAALAWLREHGHGKIIKNVFSVIPSTPEEVTLLQQRLEGFDYKDDSSVHASTLSSFVRGKLERGEDVPMELFGVYAQRSSKIQIAEKGDNVDG